MNDFLEERDEESGEQLEQASMRAGENQAAEAGLGYFAHFVDLPVLSSVLEVPFFQSLTDFI